MFMRGAIVPDPVRYALLSRCGVGTQRVAGRSRARANRSPAIVDVQDADSGRRGELAGAVVGVVKLSDHSHPAASRSFQDVAAAGGARDQCDKETGVERCIQITCYSQTPSPAPQVLQITSP